MEMEMKMEMEMVMLTTRIRTCPPTQEMETMLCPAK